MTNFEIQLKSIFDAYNGIEIDTDEAVKLHAPTLLFLAKKEIELNHFNPNENERRNNSKLSNRC